MITLFSKSKDLQIKLDKLTTDHDTLKLSFDEVAKKNVELEAKVKELESKTTGVPVEQFESLKKSNDELLKSITELKTTIEDLSVKATNVDLVASDKALEIMQNIGVPQLNVKQEVEEKQSRFVITDMKPKQ